MVGQIAFQSRPSNPLASDASIRALDNRLITSLSSEMSHAGPFNTIFDMGLSVDEDGYLEKSSLVRSLDDAMSDDFANVSRAFTDQDGIATKCKIYCPITLIQMAY